MNSGRRELLGEVELFLGCPEPRSEEQKEPKGFPGAVSDPWLGR